MKIVDGLLRSGRFGVAERGLDFPVLVEGLVTRPTRAKEKVIVDRDHRADFGIALKRPRVAMAFANLGCKTDRGMQRWGLVEKRFGEPPVPVAARNIAIDDLLNLRDEVCDRALFVQPADRADFLEQGLGEAGPIIAVLGAQRCERIGEASPIPDVQRFQ